MNVTVARAHVLHRNYPFDPSVRAFYYVRVIEIPKPRWTVHDAKYFGIEIPDGVLTTVQDRAYTSPIWFTPDQVGAHGTIGR